MTVEIREEPSSALAEYARVPMAFEVSELFTLPALDVGLGGFPLVAERVGLPYVKDHDSDPDHHPTAWPTRFDISRWGILAAWINGERAGGAVVAWDTPGLDMLGGRSDLAVLWDLRVAPTWRERGVGRALFRAAEAWALSDGARWIKIETQNINTVACRFYAREGCTLRAMNRFAYPALPEEAQLLWYKELEIASTPMPCADGTAAAH